MPPFSGVNDSFPGSSMGSWEACSSIPESGITPSEGGGVMAGSEGSIGAEYGSSGGSQYKSSSESWNIQGMEIKYKLYIFLLFKVLQPQIKSLHSEI